MSSIFVGLGSRPPASQATLGYNPLAEPSASAPDFDGDDETDSALFGNADKTELPVPMPFKSYCFSKPFKFIVGMGYEKKEFTMHAALVAELSPKFDTLVNNGMKESLEHCAYFTEDDPDIFRHFGDFAYTGTYEVGEPQRRNRDHEHYGQGVTCNKRKRGVSLPTNRTFTSGLGENLQQRVSQLSDLWKKMQRLCPEAPEPPSRFDYEGEGYDYSETLLTHAKVYIFADYYGVEFLQHLALHKLCGAMLRVGYFGNMSFHDDFIKLAKYTSEHPVCIGPDRLRQLIILYATFKFSQLWKREDFRELVASDSDFLVALMNRLQDRFQ